MRKSRHWSVFVILGALAASVSSAQPLNASGHEASLIALLPRQLASQDACVSPELYSQVQASTAVWQGKKLLLSVASTVISTILIFWQRVSKLSYKSRGTVEENAKYSKVEADSMSDVSTGTGFTAASDLEADTASDVEAPSSPQPQQGLPRLLGFAVLWTCVATTAGGFGPAYVVRAAGKPWFFDAIRQIGPNSFQLTTTVHALAGAVWVVIMAHQLVTAWSGVPPRDASSKTFGRSHRAVGYFGAVCIGCCAATGCIVTMGSEVSRLADSHPVIIDGVYIVLNFAAAIAAVLQGNVHAHKQGMTWVIVWTAWPGALRLCGYAQAFLSGITDVAVPGCQRLLQSNTQVYCEVHSFVSSSAGIGGMAPAYAYVFCAGAGVIVTALGLRGHGMSSIDWGLLMGNVVGMFAISVGHELLLAAPYGVSKSFLWACLGCEQPLWCEPSCESDKSLCT